MEKSVKKSLLIELTGCLDSLGASLLTLERTMYHQEEEGCTTM